MGDIINLRRVRKAKARGVEAMEAEANRRKHGLTRAERASAKRERSAATRVLDNARIDRE